MCVLGVEGGLGMMRKEKASLDELQASPASPRTWG